MSAMNKSSLQGYRQVIEHGIKGIEGAVDEAKSKFSGVLSTEDERKLRSIEGAVRSGIADLKNMADGLWSNVSINLDLDADEDEDDEEAAECDKPIECPTCHHKAVVPVGFPEFYSNTAYGDGEDSGGLRLRFMCHGCRRVSKLYLIYSLDGTGTIMRWA